MIPRIALRLLVVNHRFCHYSLIIIYKMNNNYLYLFNIILFVINLACYTRYNTFWDDFNSCVVTRLLQLHTWCIIICDFFDFWFFVYELSLYWFFFFSSMTSSRYYSYSDSFFLVADRLLYEIFVNTSSGWFWLWHS